MTQNPIPRKNHTDIFPLDCAKYVLGNLKDIVFQNHGFPASLVNIPRAIAANCNLAPPQEKRDLPEEYGNYETYATYDSYEKKRENEANPQDDGTPPPSANPYGTYADYASYQEKREPQEPEGYANYENYPASYDSYEEKREPEASPQNDGTPAGKFTLEIQNRKGNIY